MIENITYNEYLYLMNRIGYWLIKNNKKCAEKNIYNTFFSKRTADLGTIKKVLKERGTDYTSDELTGAYSEYAILNTQDINILPAYVQGFKQKFDKATYTDMVKRVTAYRNGNTANPLIVYIKTTTTNTTNTTNNSNSNNGLISKLTSWSGIKIDGPYSLYNAFKKLGHYGYYYNDVYTQSQALNRLKLGQTLNCTDLAQLYYTAMRELGYNDNNLQIVRGTIKCTQTYGHIWCRVKIDGSWKTFDPSAAAKGKNAGNMICGYITSITSINPNWLVNDDGKT